MPRGHWNETDYSGCSVSHGLAFFSALRMQNRHLSTQGVFGRYRKQAPRHVVVQLFTLSDR